MNEERGLSFATFIFVLNGLRLGESEQYIRWYMWDYTRLKCSFIENTGKLLILLQFLRFDIEGHNITPKTTSLFLKLITICCKKLTNVQ